MLGLVVEDYIPEDGSGSHSTIFGSNSSFLRNLLRRLTETLACTVLEMRNGSIVIGNWSRLKRERATNALSAVSCCSGS